MLRCTGFIAATMLLLAGCSHHPEAKEARCTTDLSQAQCQDVNRYIHQINALVMRNFHDAPKYAGQRCLVTAQRRPDGRYNVMRTEGNESLCLKAWQSVSSARDMPLPPQGAPQQIVFAFAPTR
ncbi:cell envelope integrity TolA C-terminal domain-containing protein [Pantoea allii]|uniref:cell envelope integrity TolA C-terminal domain-containing protein n=1 Tax=Pantoea allii TaxID=574096 RepID=UPI000A2229E5|nr:cell envelope integrity TolA C-terminal domain-containing protein [Pantoea allii]MBW1253325.1 cell envelope biogenesis protein TolA [Pantoea allii]MBW1262579.1 cell envelope biogenesis protein TolA [Pantoea allii]MBW1284417.1 cell envelope biogenesis protein TolA [Pantoea allii]ORM83929.1 cell envelope biogenesis protein TolA [Pantoea allii]PBJ99432.1 cell envelope biogenesis protein TolA [Pantoea allii]